MFGKIARISFVFVGSLMFITAYYFCFPFGLIPKEASPNCGPEHRRWLGERFKSKSDIIAYLQAHELELLSGTNTPRLDGTPPGVQNSRMDVEIDWQTITADIQVNHRVGYNIYTLIYHHPACSTNQSFSLRITSYGFASLYGCCGV
jgi:hypothetical protein